MEQRVQILRQYREKIPLLFSDNLVTENQMLLYQDVDEEGGIFQLSESKFHRTQNRRENIFLEIYEAIENDLGMGDWNSKAYGELKTREVSLLGSLLNIQSNAIDGITPGISPADHCEYISEHITEKSDSVEDCADRLNHLTVGYTEQYEKYFSEDSEVPNDGLFIKVPFTSNWKILTLPLPEISENSPAFGVEVKLALIEADSVLQRGAEVREEYAESPFSFKVYVGAAENCLQNTHIDFLTDFVRQDDNYFRDHEYNAHVSLTARYDLEQCQGQKRQNLCLYIKSSSTEELNKDLLVRTAPWPPIDDGEFDDFLSDFKSLKTEIYDDELNCMDAYDSWLTKIGDQTQANVTISTSYTPNILLTHSYEDGFVRNETATEAELQNLHAYLQNSAKQSIIPILQSGTFIGGASVFVLLLVLTITCFAVNRKLRQREEPETIYTVVRAAPRNLQRKFSKMTFKAGRKRPPEASNPGLPVGYRREDV